MRYQNEYYEGNHPPLIAKALFDRCQEVMSQKSKPKSNTLKPYLYRGVFHCGECGRQITTETQKGHNYLRCSKWEVKCLQRYVREERIAEEVTTAIGSLAMAATWADWMLEQLRLEEMTYADAAADTIQSLTEHIEGVVGQLNRLMAAYVQGVLTLQEYREGKNKLMDEKRAVEEKRALIQDDSSSAFEPIKSFLKAAKQAEILANEGTNEQKRDFLKTTASNLTIRDRHLSFLPRDAWKLVVDQGCLAHQPAALSSSAATFAGESNRDLQKRRR